MSRRFQAPRGTFDVLPGDSEARERIHALAASIFERAGYRRIETPAFEETELFARGVGETTDIVRKEMFTFTDQGGRSLTLRPEGTAPVCRAYVEHGMHTLAQPVKLWYWGPFFRHERPQAGRFRQFTQLGVEAIGSDSPLVDAEVIILLDQLLGGLEIPDVALRLGSLGSQRSRREYRAELSRYLRSHEMELAPAVRERIDVNPMRAFDADDQGTRAVMAAAPKMLDHLDPGDAEHFAAVRGLLDRAGVHYEVDPSLVRGLDYYTRTVFEFTCERLGAQSGVGGGGRYDDLVELIGGPPTPAAGWAAGVDRILLALEGERPEPAADAFVVAEEGRREGALALAHELRRSGLRADLDLAGRSTKGQMKQADRIDARFAVILTTDEAATALLRDMRSGEEREIDPGQVVEEISAALERFEREGG